MSIQSADSESLFEYLATYYNATEENPLRLGNAEFWWPVEGYAVALVHNPSINQWNIDAVQRDANEKSEPCWENLCKFLSLPKETRRKILCEILRDRPSITHLDKPSNRS